MQATKCETCCKEVEPEFVNNGIGMEWHYVHCGWGHTAREEDVYEAKEQDHATGK